MVPNPILEKRGEAWFYVYKERSIEQAQVLKLARGITGLRSLNLLNRAGLFTEQCVIQRTLDEINEDIDFLAVANAAGGAGDLQERLLEAFFNAELPDSSDPSKRTKKPATVPRRKIRAWMNNQPTAPSNPSQLNDIAENISSAYSQYVHVSANTCLELYLGDPPYFHLEGVTETHFRESYEKNIIDYFFRGILSASMVAITLNAEEHQTEIIEFQDLFVDATGVGNKARRTE